MPSYEMSEEQRRIIMVALAGFELERGERATIRPLLLRMIRDYDPTLIKPSALAKIQEDAASSIGLDHQRIQHPPPSSPDFERHCIGCPLCNLHRLYGSSWSVKDGKLEIPKVCDWEYGKIAEAIQAFVPSGGRASPADDDENRFKMRRWLDAAERAFREVVASDVARAKEANESAKKTPIDIRTATALNPQAVVFQQVAVERDRQDKQWGGAAHDGTHERKDWLGFVDEHNARAKKALARPDLDEYRKQLVEVAALAIAGVEAHDRKTAVKR